jgi:hypothetical protein
MRNFKTITKQKGALAILMAFIIGIGVITYLLQSLDPQRLRAEQDAKTMRTLNEAKKALIAWSVSHQHTPGQMPWPDRNADGNYDGSSDCSPVAGVFTPQLMLGQLPSLPTTAPCLDPNTGLNLYAGLSTYPGLGQEFKDAQGNRLWYAVSRNLVYDYENNEAPIINPGMINEPHAITPYLRQGGTQSYPWLRVLDRNGNLVSDRVAVVLIAPGDAIGGQSRVAAANSNQFLDRFQIGATNFSNSDSALVDEDYLMGVDSRDVAADDPTYVQPYYFNDKLVYITIDELMAALEKRVGEQVRSSLKTYQDTNGYYPYATQLGTANNFACELTTNLGVTGLTNGFLPVDNQSCTYTRTGTTQTNLTCTQQIFDAGTSGVTQIRFDRTSGGTLTAASSGACVRNSTTRCTCTGAGTCGVAPNRVICNATNCLSEGMMGSYRVTSGKFRFRSAGCAFTTFPTKTALGCSNSNSVITCNTSNGVFSSCGDADFGVQLPSWFKTNQWQNFVYYQMTRPALASLNVGIRSTEALLVTTGKPINTVPFAVSRGASQLRPSCNTLNNYLDSVENANGDAVYDATSTQDSASYNDQTFVVAP